MQRQRQGVDTVMVVPLDGTIATALSNLVDGSRGNARYSSHNDIDFLVKRHGLSSLDPQGAGGWAESGNG